MPISLLLVLVLFFNAYVLVITIVNGGELAKVSYYSLYPVAVCIIYQALIHNDTRNFINISATIFEIYIYLNFLFMLILPVVLSLDSPVFLLTTKNSLIKYILPALAFSIIRSHITYQALSFRPKLLMAVSLLTVILANSATAIVVMVVVIGGIALMHLFKGFRIHAGIGILVSVVFFIMIIIFRGQEMFSWFINTVLRRTASFSGRTALWDRALDIIKSNTLFGNGDSTTPFWKLNFTFQSTHNYYLDLMVIGGVILLTVFILMMIYVLYKMNSHKGTYYYKLLSILLLGYFILMGPLTFVSNDFPLFIGFLTLCVNIEAFEQAARETHEKNSAS